MPTVLVLNDPNSLSLAVNKMYFQSFPEAARAETLITKHAADVKTFAKKHGGECILKPLQGSGGSGVFKLDAGPQAAPPVVHKPLARLVARRALAAG